MNFNKERKLYGLKPLIKQTKVQMFKSKYIYDMEKSINEFIKNKTILDIKLSDIGDKVIAMVIYEECSMEE